MFGKLPSAWRVPTEDIFNSKAKFLPATLETPMTSVWEKCFGSYCLFLRIGFLRIGVVIVYWNKNGHKKKSWNEMKLYLPKTCCSAIHRHLCTFSYTMSLLFKMLWLLSFPFFTSILVLKGSMIYQNSSVPCAPLTEFDKHKGKPNLRRLTYGHHSMHIINISGVLIICSSNCWCKVRIVPKNRGLLSKALQWHSLLSK